MTGRGVDQIMAYPSDPVLHEGYIKNAIGYVELAEELNGPIPRSVSPEYVWGDALEELRRVEPDARVINLETSVTTSNDWERKGINYRMHPKNVSCLSVARIDCCVLANNHVLDWGNSGLIETLETLAHAGIKTAGAGRDSRQACAPAIIETGKRNGRILVFALGLESSGVPPEWAATGDRGGVWFLEDLSEASLLQVRMRIADWKKPGDIAIVSIHWGGNWGYEIPDEQRRFAHALIEKARVDLVYGHSSHHFKALEVHHGKLIFYGCGDLLTDYEGITGYESFRGDLALLYFPRLDAETGDLLSLRMMPMQVKRFRLNHPSQEDRDWMADVFNREEREFGTSVEQMADGSFHLRWRK